MCGILVERDVLILFPTGGTPRGSIWRMPNKTVYAKIQGVRYHLDIHVGHASGMWTVKNDGHGLGVLQGVPPGYEDD